MTTNKKVLLRDVVCGKVYGRPGYKSYFIIAYKNKESNGWIGFCYHNLFNKKTIKEILPATTEWEEI